ncbi:MAG: sigma 54-interacting transcriptional regulator [Desulfobacterales bacterium]
MDLPSAEHARIILDSIGDGVFTVDLNRVITFFNRAAERITGFSRTEAVGRHCWEIFKTGICQRGCSVQQALEEDAPVVRSSVTIVNSADEKIPVSSCTAVLKDPLGRAIGAVETFRDLSDVQQLRRELAGKQTFAEIISKNDKMLRLIDMLEMVAEKDIPVLLEGERGTEKEILAKALHSLSGRRNGPLVTLCCGSLPDTLVEPELFGHPVDAAAGNRAPKPGRMALAAGGTLFLDDIDALPPKLQHRLAQVFRHPVDGPPKTGRPAAADVRIVAATRKNLVENTSTGSFDKELHELIGTVTFRIPPLRERREDIAPLADHLIAKYNDLNGKAIEGVAPEALSILMGYDYPGNTQELERIIEYCLVVCPQGVLKIEHLPENLFRKSNRAPHPSDHAPRAANGSLMTVERAFIYKSLVRNAWNRKATAEEMGIHPTTLWRKMKRLKMEMPVKERRQRPR